MQTFRQFIEELEKIHGSQLGSNSGGLHLDEKGNKYYVKKYKNSDQAKSEVLAGKIYKHMGIHTVEPEMHEDDHVKSKWNEHLYTKKPNFYDNPSEHHANQLSKMYHAGVLTKNWDIVGLEHDNIMHNEKSNDLHSIDHGGAFNFRAQGGHKDYGPDIKEKESLRDNSLPSGRVFNAAFRKHPNSLEHGKEAVRKIDDNHIHHLFKNSGLKNWKDLHSAFAERKKALLS